jgi:hypothetical protein
VVVVGEGDRPVAKNVVVNRLILETINVGYVVPVLLPTRMRSEGPEKANITTSVVWSNGTYQEL